MIADLQIIEQINIVLESRIILYGCGYRGKQAYFCLKKQNIVPDMVCETKKSNKNFFGLPVYSIEDIREHRDETDVLILVCSDIYYESMIEECEKLKFKFAKIATAYGFFLSLKMHCGEDVLDYTFDKLIANHKECSNLHWARINMNYAWEMLVRVAEPEKDILIFQPGKVGSQSIGKSIRDRSLQLHSLAIPYSFQQKDRQMADIYLECLKARKLKIITAVREPIARDVAAFFQNSDVEIWPFDTTNKNIFWWYGDYFKKKGEKLGLKKIEERNQHWKGSLKKSFEYLCDTIISFRLDIFSWFDYEIKNVLGIDIYKYPFDKVNGYSRITEGNIELLIIKTEKLSQLQNVIADFIEDENYILDTTNEGNQKIYRYAYMEFKKELKIKENYYNYYYKNNLALSHFYTEEEQDSFRRYWESRIM